MQAITAVARVVVVAVAVAVTVVACFVTLALISASNQHACFLQHKQLTFQAESFWTLHLTLIKVWVSWTHHDHFCSCFSLLKENKMSLTTLLV